MIELSFSDISERLKNFSFPDIDLVVGIATGGVVPASLIAHQLQCPLRILTINYRDQENTPLYDAPMLMKELPEIPQQTHILLVDDVSVTGRTLQLAKSLLKGNAVTTFTLKGKAELVLFPQIAECVNWPWKAHQISYERST
ncbi:MAG: phosphoribosyltransferase [Cyclobacteriaceae bacterium]|nr:phosphoribosyltransferase [Cyclobacteriaceae bacterium]